MQRIRSRAESASLEWTATQTRSGGDGEDDESGPPPSEVVMLGKRVDGILQLEGGDSPEFLRLAGRSCGVWKGVEEAEEGFCRGLRSGWLGAATTAASSMMEPTMLFPHTRGEI